MVVFALGLLTGIIWLFIKLVLYMVEAHRRKTQSINLVAYPDTTSETDTAERAALQERINRLYIQLDLLRAMSAALDDTPADNPQTALKARLTNEKQIAATLDKIQKLENKLARPE
jgi:hypothetical protein